MSTDILSQDEVDALLGGVDDGAIDTSAEEIEIDGEARSFDFNNQERIIRGRLPTLEMINDRFARYFRVSFFNMLRKSPEISVNGIEMIKFSEYIHTLYVPTSLNMIKMEPLRGTGLIMLDPKLVFILVDNFFGGDGTIHAKIEGREFTNTELRVIERIVQMSFGDLVKAWEPVMAVEYSYHNHEVNPHMANIVSPTEVIVVSNFHVELDGGGGDLHIVYPYSMIEPIRTVLDAGVQSDHGELDERWSILLKEELMHAKIELQALFVEKQLPVSDLINFKAGDIIPIDMPEQVLLLAEELPIIRGQYGEHQGNTAIKVEEIVEIYDPENQDIKSAIAQPE
ncbi:MAG: flagellar motor switch protein FliM [Gammaproteobacteria bacterium]|nr:flagellar motor switch protein FliM [Gammaproteobacteria bacterium]MCP4979174.1 flagellar motor switch protein FliM [Gammaproteobacteria bacterium]